MTIAYVNVPTAPIATFPAQLFFGGRQGGWYDPSDLTTLFQDTAGTVPVTADGQLVALMRDKSGNSNHLTQPSVSSRPTYKAAGGLRWLAFDGVDDVLASTNLLSVTGDFVISGGFQSDLNSNSVSQANVFGVLGSGTRYVQLTYRTNTLTSNTFRTRSGGNVDTFLLASFNKDVPCVLIGSLKSATIYDVLRNGASVLSTVGSGAFTAITGSVQAGHEALALKFYGGVMVLGASLVNSEKIALNKYLAARTGVAL